MERRDPWVLALALGLASCLHPPGDPAAANASPPATQPVVRVEPSPAASEAPPPAATVTDAGVPAPTAAHATAIFGRGSDAGLPAAPDGPAPPANGQARGNIDKEIVRRVIRSHIKEAKDCYEAELVKRPGLGGRIEVRFTLAASGEVIDSLLEGSTMGSPAVESCVVEAVRRWQFPKLLNRDRVTISYPFVLTPAGPGASATPAKPAP